MATDFSNTRRGRGREGDVCWGAWYRWTGYVGLEGLHQRNLLLKQIKLSQRVDTRVVKIQYKEVEILAKDGAKEHIGLQYMWKLMSEATDTFFTFRGIFSFLKTFS